MAMNAGILVEIVPIISHAVVSLEKIITFG